MADGWRFDAVTALDAGRARQEVMERRGWKRRVARRGGIAAHVVTFTNLGCGFAALLLLHEGQVNLAVSLIFLATVLDFFDGALARMAGHGSCLRQGAGLAGRSRLVRRGARLPGVPGAGWPLAAGGRGVSR